MRGAPLEHDRAAGANGESAQTFTLVSQVPTRRLTVSSPRPCEARDWRRVAELRLDRVETLATAAQRAQELTGIARILQGSSATRTARSTSSSTRARWTRSGAAVLEALRYAYEASGRAPPIDPAGVREGVRRRTGAPGRRTRRCSTPCSSRRSASRSRSTWRVVEQSRSVGPMQALKPLDAAAWEALRAPGFDEGLASLLAGVHDTAVAARLEQLPSSRRLRSLDAATTARRREHGLRGEDPALGRARPRRRLPRSLCRGPTTPATRSRTSERSAVDHARAARALGHVRQAARVPRRASADLVPARVSLHALLPRARRPPATSWSEARRGAEVALGHWIRSAELTAARAGIAPLRGAQDRGGRRALTAVRSRAPARGARGERSRRLLCVAGARGAPRAVPEALPEPRARSAGRLTRVDLRPWTSGAAPQPSEHAPQTRCREARGLARSEGAEHERPDYERQDCARIRRRERPA